jgi:hypothetical protein
MARAAFFSKMTPFSPSKLDICNSYRFPVAVSSRTFMIADYIPQQQDSSSAVKETMSLARALPQWVMLSYF